MKTKTLVLKHEGKIVHTAYPWDSEENRQYNRKRLHKKLGVWLDYVEGPDAEVIHV